MTNVTTPGGPALERVKGTFTYEIYQDGVLAYRESSAGRSVFLQPEPGVEPTVYHFYSAGSYTEGGSACTFSEHYQFANGVLRFDVYNVQCAA